VSDFALDINDSFRGGGRSVDFLDEIHKAKGIDPDARRDRHRAERRGTPLSIDPTRPR